MATTRFTVHSSLSPSEVMAVITDFGPDRARWWPNVDEAHFTVHDQGADWAEVTEGTGMGWERERYTWDAAAGTVSAVTVNSNIWASGSGWNYTIMPEGTGSRVEVTAVRKGYGVKGKLVGALLSLVGKREITSSTTAALGT